MGPPRLPAAFLQRTDPQFTGAMRLRDVDDYSRSLRLTQRKGHAQGARAGAGGGHYGRMVCAA